MPLNIYSSNRMENLVATLSVVLKKPLKSPIASEFIVMQSAGMQRWVAMELAGRLGVWANCIYPFPNAMLWQLFNSILSSPVDASSFDPENLAWKIFSLLPQYNANPDFLTLSHYISDDDHGLKRYQLSTRIADTFDQYTLFRPEILSEWEQGVTPVEPDIRWQAILWRRLLRECGVDHRGALLEHYCKTIANNNFDPSILPERISLFGISYLPPYHLKILDSTASATEINMFLLSPTYLYWGDIISPREQARKNKASTNISVEDGHPLLASFGTLGKNFFNMTLNLQNSVESSEQLYHLPKKDSLLHYIQADILNLQTPSGVDKPSAIKNDDKSMVVASCHSPLREVEALHDFLLDRFNKDSQLEPRHVVVMTTDVEQYAPYIISVFGAGMETAPKIPFSIADRSTVATGEIANILIQIMKLPSSRFTSLQLFDLLSLKPVMKRFNLSSEDLVNIRHWLSATAIRWGIDESARVESGLPQYAENSWHSGFDRLLAGYAMSDGDGENFAGIIPFDGPEGTDVALAGKLMDYVECMKKIASDLKAPRSLFQWGETLREVAAIAIADDNDYADELIQLNNIFAHLQEIEKASGYDEPVSFNLLCSWLTSKLNDNSQSQGFLTGGVTFCAMLPMRSIPFKIIALLGMSEGSFPRQSKRHGFDIMAQHPRTGDRCLRDEDRYLFLEALLSARETLYISYIGQSIQDGSQIPPSVLVSELLDSIDSDYKLSDNQPVSKAIVVKHPLQPFSETYFKPDSSLFSYSRENLQALLGHKKEKSSRPFLSKPLPEPSETTFDIKISQLLSFFCNPVRYFLQNRFGLDFQRQEQLLDERETFELDSLQKYSLKNLILDGILCDQSSPKILAMAWANGMLPPSEHGKLLFKELQLQVIPLAEQVKRFASTQTALETLECSLDLSPFNITGRLNNIFSGAMLRYRHAAMKGTDLVAAWIEHLMLNSMNAKGYPTETLLIMDGSIRRLLTVHNPIEHLTNLLEIFQKGQCQPIPYFPKSAYSYSHKKLWSIEAARQEWQKSNNETPSESEEPSFALCFGNLDPFDHEFEKICHKIYEPLLDHCQEVKDA